MSNDEFQKLVLEQFSTINMKLDNMDGRLTRMEQRLDRVEARLDCLEERMGRLEERVGCLEEEVSSVKVELKSIKTRQDEIYNVVKAVEHSNNVGKAELDKHNFRLARLEGRFKQIARVYDSEFDAVSSL